MSTATTPTTMAAPVPLEMPGPVARVPSLGEIYRLTEVPDQRVVFRSVDWAFYEELVDSIPEGARRTAPQANNHLSAALEEAKESKDA